MKRGIIILIAILWVGIQFSNANNEKEPCSSTHKISFNSSDTLLTQVFYWAKNQALAYAFSNVRLGLWYEAALPGREAFCMRDVSHQAMGAHFLGLGDHTKNMLFKFSENISDEKDWCSYWEINRYNLPAPVDYYNDNEFWYNLPANFDVLDCCFRMYYWTGDRIYIEDEVFLNFYEKTVKDYVERWNLGVEKIMDRQRLMNIKEELNPDRRFVMSRGIPGYNEGDPKYSVGFDLVVSQYKAFLGYTQIQQLISNEKEAQKYQDKTAEIAKLINTSWWDKRNNQFYTHVNSKHELESKGHDHSVLYWQYPVKPEMLKTVLDSTLNNLPKGPVNSVEQQSHLPEILYHYNEPNEAYKQLTYLYEAERREYPEVSFSVVGAMVTGLMGIEIQLYPPADALSQGIYVDRAIKTFSRLNNETNWAEINNVPIRANFVSVKHDGLSKTTFVNQSGPSLIWKASFPGTHENLLLNGKSIPAQTDHLESTDDKVASWINVIVGAGETMIVQVP